MSRWQVPALIVAFAGFSPLLADDAAKPGEAAIRAAGQAYVAAFNSHDAAAVGKLWSQNAIHTDRHTGVRTVGRAAIQAELTEVFESTPNIHLQFQPGEIRFIKPDVASISSTATVIVPDSDPNVMAVSAIMINDGGQWLLDSVEELPAPAPESAQDALRELDWLVGEWQDDSSEVSATSSFRWSAGETFLVRSFSATVEDVSADEGTQVIGWDPRGQHIRSWTFHSNGTFGEAVWSRNGNDWMVKSTQTLADGELATGTYVMTQLDEDSMSVKLIGHEVAGEPQPAGPTVRVVRVQPAAEPTAEGGAQ